MCEYCDGTGKEINEDVEDYSVRITYERYLTVEYYNGFCGTCKINFCPMCGRKFER